jgi:hypothetical protein
VVNSKIQSPNASAVNSHLGGLYRKHFWKTGRILLKKELLSKRGTGGYCRSVTFDGDTLRLGAAELAAHGAFVGTSS